MRLKETVIKIYSNQVWSGLQRGNCFGIDIGTDAAKLTNVIIARFGEI